MDAFSVAQVWNLLPQRRDRFAIGWLLGVLMAMKSAFARQVTNSRYRRLQICATGAAFTLCAYRGGPSGSKPSFQVYPFMGYALR